MAAIGILGVVLPVAANAASDEVACRTTSASQGTTELRLQWEGGSAKGVLQRVAPSGNTTSVRVRAERVSGMIVADDVHEADLVTHAAVVREMSGKRYMRSGDDKDWLVCE